MGGGHWDDEVWDDYAATNVRGKADHQIFTATGLDAKWNPASFDFRESRDSADNPNSTPILLASDVTGSMGVIAVELMRNGLNKIASEIRARKPVSDPHVGVLAVGDAFSDRAPIQATQFEADIRLADQVRELFIEGNGGGNGGESYSLAHLFAALKTRTDASEKRGRKGYLFTIGDEPIHAILPKEKILKFLGVEVAADMTAVQCAALASRNWHVFHIVLGGMGWAAHGLSEVLASWKPVLPESTIVLDDLEALAETVVSLIEVTEGACMQDVVQSWSGSKSLVVANALQGMSVARTGGARGVRRLGA